MRYQSMFSPGVPFPCRGSRAHLEIYTCDQGPLVIRGRGSRNRCSGNCKTGTRDGARDGDFGSTPTLFTASIGGVPRALVGAVNKNGTFYALRRGAVGAGPVWRAYISTPLNGCGICPSGDIAPAAWD